MDMHCVIYCRLQQDSVQVLDDECMQRGELFLSS